MTFSDLVKYGASDEASGGLSATAELLVTFSTATHGVTEYVSNK